MRGVNYPIMLHRTILAMLFMFAFAADSFSADETASDHSDHIVLTGGDSKAPDAESMGPVELKTQSYVLRFSAEARPVSLKTLPEGKELLNTSVVQEGFYLNCVSGKIYFAKIARRGDGRLVFKTANETQQIICSVGEKDKYLAFKIDELIGIPSACAFTLHFNLDVDPSIRSFALDYMTTANRLFPVNWFWIWHRNTQDPMGGFALYRKQNDEDEDDTLLKIWVNEGLPHPKIQGDWTMQRAQKWVRDWIKEFSDTSVLWYTFPKSPDEIKDLLPYLKKADIREVHLMPWTWASGKHHCEVNPKFFTGGRKQFAEYSKLLNDNGIRLTIHYDFCGIPFDDPVYVGQHPDPGLASWGQGTLSGDVNETSTTLLFKPDPGTELPFLMDPFYYRVNPPAQHCVSYFNYIRIGDEIVKVGAYKNTNAPVWTLENCTRGLGSTEPASHKSGDKAIGLDAMFNVLYIPGANTALFDRMTQEFADLMNECNISHAEYDGVNPAYSANSQWLYRKFLGQAYSQFDHPVTLGSGYGEAPTFGYFEYELNAVQKMQDHALGPRGDIGARIRTSSICRPASTVDETQFRMSQVAAFANKSFPLFFEVHYPSEWQKYGRFDEICGLVSAWKKASSLMTDQQHEQIRKTLCPPNTRGYESDIIWRLRDEKDQYVIAPSKNPLTREKGDVRWGCGGGEMGYIVPCQYVKPDQELVLENPYSAQPPKFVIQIMSATSADDPGNIALLPDKAEIKNASETRVDREGDALTFSAENSLNSLLDNRNGDRHYPSWDNKLDLTEHRAVGMWVTGDNSKSVLVLRMPENRDYVVPIDFEGKRYFEIPNGEAYWANSAWGGPDKSAAFRFSYKIEWLKMGFGELPANSKAVVRVEGLQALKETASELRDPIIQVNGGRLAISGSIPTDHYLEFSGGSKAIVYDSNWNKVRELEVKNEGYSMPTGYHAIKITTADSSAPRPWMSVRFMTEGEPMVIKKKANH